MPDQDQDCFLCRGGCSGHDALTDWDAFTKAMLGLAVILLLASIASQVLR